ncbi:MAG: bifunctional aspartate kinase/homoserine dehydrogenase I, partial [Gemmatimonadetes bacterium]|nr:bifunctional aspartate kinase/homoserine dehydrogenase I [Gemmatimonadota bacterium]
MMDGISSARDPWVVHKFGGTSVANAERYRHVAQVLSERPEPRKAVVVSAMSGVTDALIRAVDRAERRDPEYQTVLEDLRRQHREVVSELMPLERGRELMERIERDLGDIADVLRGIWLLRSHSLSAMELISGYGEVWSAQMLAHHL